MNYNEIKTVLRVPIPQLHKANENEAYGFLRRKLEGSSYLPANRNVNRGVTFDGDYQLIYDSEMKIWYIDLVLACELDDEVHFEIENGGLSLEEIEFLTKEAIEMFDVDEDSVYLKSIYVWNDVALSG